MTELPDLSQLTHEEKDALIRVLWAQVQALTAQVQTLVARMAGLEAKLGQPPKVFAHPPCSDERWAGWLNTADEALRERVATSC